MSCIVCFKFIYIKIELQCEYGLQMKEIFDKLINKTHLAINSFKFYYDGKIIDTKAILTLKEIISQLDERNNRMLIFANCIEEHKIKINHQNKITEMIIEPIGKMGDIFKEFCSYEKIDIDSFYFCFMERVICHEINARYYLDYFLKKKFRRNFNC